MLQALSSKGIDIRKREAEALRARIERELTGRIDAKRVPIIKPGRTGRIEAKHVPRTAQNTLHALQLSHYVTVHTGQQSAVLCSAMQWLGRHVSLG